MLLLSTPIEYYQAQARVNRERLAPQRGLLGRLLDAARRGVS